VTFSPRVFKELKRKAYKIQQFLQVECEYPGGERRLFRDNTQIFSTFYPAHSVVKLLENIGTASRDRYFLKALHVLVYADGVRNFE
jgi:hypothetical protein